MLSIPAIEGDQVNACQESEQARYGEVSKVLPAGYQSAGDGLGPVDRAEVVILIDPPHVVREVIEDVITGMSHDESEGESQPGNEMEGAIAGREDAGERCRQERHDQNGGPRRDQPARDDVQLIPFVLGDIGNHVQGLLPHGEIDFHVPLLRS